MKMKRGTTVKLKSGRKTYNELLAKIEDLPGEDTISEYISKVMESDKDLTDKEVLKDVLLNGYLAGREEAERELDELRNFQDISFDDLM